MLVKESMIGQPAHGILEFTTPRYVILSPGSGQLDPLCTIPVGTYSMALSFEPDPCVGITVEVVIDTPTVPVVLLPLACNED